MTCFSHACCVDNLRVWLIATSHKILQLYPTLVSSFSCLAMHNISHEPTIIMSASGGWWKGRFWDYSQSDMVDRWKNDRKNRQHFKILRHKTESSVGRKRINRSVKDGTETDRTKKNLLHNSFSRLRTILQLDIYVGDASVTLNLNGY